MQAKVTDKRQQQHQQTISMTTDYNQSKINKA